MTVNTQLLQQVMQHIQDHPEQHDQTVWVNECGTAACFAGWACLLSGWQLAHGDLLGIRATSPDTRVKRLAPDVARDLLGISFEMGVALFAQLNTRPMLALMVKDLVNGEALRDTDEYRKEAGS